MGAKPIGRCGYGGFPLGEVEVIVTAWEQHELLGLQRAFEGGERKVGRCRSVLSGDDEQQRCWPDANDSSPRFIHRGQTRGAERTVTSTFR